MAVKESWRGRFFEDFQAGDIYQHPLGRSVSETDNTMNTAEPHFNAEAGRASEFGASLVNSALTVAIATGQSVIDTSFNAMANLCWEEIRLTHPVFAADTLWSESLMLSTRSSKRHPKAGVVSLKTWILNQHGDQVLSFRRTFLVYRDGHGRPATFPEAKSPLHE